jgi:NADH-quinone oxidoreductase subunit M
LPGFANFTGEITVFFGAWKVFRWVTVLGCWGALLVGALYMLRAVRSMLHGPLPERWAEIADAPHFWRKAPFVILLAGMLVFGCFPGLLANKIQASVQPIVARFAPATPTTAQATVFPAGSTMAKQTPITASDSIVPTR